MWGKYSWRAITCCVSKGVLITLAIASVIGGIGFSVYRGEVARKAKVAMCDELRSEIDRIQYWVASWTVDETGQAVRVRDDAAEARWRELSAQYNQQCVTPTKETPPWVHNAQRWADAHTPDWLGPLVAATLPAFIAFLIAAGVTASICAGTITYCQAAVETGRRPWYWLPARFGGDPLPGRQMVKCEGCGHQKEETDDQYRVRLGLEPLEIVEESAS